MASEDPYQGSSGAQARKILLRKSASASTCPSLGNWRLADWPAPTSEAHSGQQRVQSIRGLGSVGSLDVAEGDRASIEVQQKLAQRRQVEGRVLGSTVVLLVPIIDEAAAVDVRQSISLLAGGEHVFELIVPATWPAPVLALG